MIIHAIDPILFESLHLTIKKASVKFQPDEISNFREKEEKPDKHSTLCWLLFMIIFKIQQFFDGNSRFFVEIIDMERHVSE